MVSRFVRRLTASLAVAAAVCLAPAQSKADVQVLVEEIGVDGVTVVASKYTTAVPDSNGFVSYSFSGQQFSLGGMVATNSSTGVPNASLTPSFSGQFKSGFDPSSVNQLNTLRITVTDDGFLGTNLSSTLANRAAASTGFSNGVGIIQVNTQSVILTALTTPASDPDTLAAGGLFAGPTAVASDSLPDNPNLTNETFVPVANGLPSNYALQQTIVVAITKTGTISQSATFGGSGGVSVDPIPASVPAPGGLVLAMIALPLLGLRRTLRKRAETV